MNSIKKNLVLNTIRQICTIIFPLITFPYATRVLKTDNYGVYTFSSSVVSYVSLLASLGISTYAVREGARIRDDRNKLPTFVNEIYSINMLSMLFSFLILAILLIFWKKLDSYRTVILILSLTVLFSTLGTDWINIIYEDYSYITKRYIVCQIIAVLVLFICVKKESDVLYYALSTAVGSITANLANMVYIRKHLHIFPRLTINKKLYYHVMPILIIFLNTIASAIYLNSDVTILGMIKNDYDVAIYGVASRIYFMVKAIANAAVAVIIPRISSLISQGGTDKIEKLYKKTAGGAIILVIASTAGLIALSGNIVKLLSGSEYIEATQPLVILSLALPFATMACLFVNGVLIPFRKEKAAAKMTIISAVGNISLNFLLIPQYSFNAAATTTLIAESFLCITGFLISKKVVKIHAGKELLLAIISGGMIFITCKIVELITNNYILHILISIVLSVAVFIAFFCLIKNNIVYDILLSIMKRVKRKSE